MNCQEFQKSMPELAGHADLAHLRQCSACAAMWDEQRRLAAGLRAASSEWRHLQAPTRVEARLTAAFRSHGGLTSGQPVGRVPSLWIPLAAWAAAAAALIALALFLVNQRQPQSPRRAPAGVEMAALQESDESPYAGGLHSDAECGADRSQRRRESGARGSAALGNDRAGV